MWFPSESSKSTHLASCRRRRRRIDDRGRWHASSTRLTDHSRAWTWTSVWIGFHQDWSWTRRASWSSSWRIGSPRGIRDIAVDIERFRVVGIPHRLGGFTGFTSTKDVVVRSRWRSCCAIADSTDVTGGSDSGGLADTRSLGSSGYTGSISLDNLGRSLRDGYTRRGRTLDDGLMIRHVSRTGSITDIGEIATDRISSGGRWCDRWIGKRDLVSISVGTSISSSNAFGDDGWASSRTLNNLTSQ